MPKERLNQIIVHKGHFKCLRKSFNQRDLYYIKHKHLSCYLPIKFFEFINN